MLLIFLDSNENGVANVCRWLDFYNRKYILVYETDIIEFIYTSLQSDEFIFKINNNIIKSSAIDSIWFRKIPFKLAECSSDLVDNNPLLNNIFKTYLNLELNTLSEYLNVICHAKVKTLGNSNTLYVNKLLQLFYAQKVGLKIPQTEIITNADDFSEKFGNSGAITKGIYDTFLFNAGSFNGTAKTSLIKMKDISVWSPKTILPSLFQSYIEKIFEIRSFFFNGAFYSMAIFSQSNEKTKIDFRNYDMVNPNRMVPFILPENIENKLQQMLSYLKIDTGSFDLIYGLDEEYYFLEVNPVGQFDFVSGMCNYNIEKTVSKHFIYE